MTYKELMNEATEALSESNIYTGFSRILMLEMMREEGMDMFSLLDEAANENFKSNYLKYVDELCQDIPLAYVLGYEWFYGYKIKVNESVLIPRGETEELVGNILIDIDAYFENPVIVDVACGSGAIGIALALELGLPVVSTDISEEALIVAKENAIELNADVHFRQGDMLEPILDMKVDVLVCNPPYIKNVEHIQTSVLNHEPHIALFGGDDGLYFYKKVFEKAHLIMNEKSMMAFEIGFDIGDALLEMAQSYFKDAVITLKQDMSGQDRMLFIYFNC